MKKFYLLLRKEIKELLTLQLVLPFVVVVIIFGLIGNIVQKQNANESQKSQDLIVVDNDNSALSKSVETFLTTNNIIIHPYANLTSEEIIAAMKNDNIPAALVIPKGFEDNISHGKFAQTETFTRIANFSVTAVSSKRISVINSVNALINGYVSSGIIKQNISSLDPAFIKNPVSSASNVIIKDKTAAVDAGQVIAFIMQETTFIPIILFLVIVLAAQMIAAAVATEKENKTLETLLSLPVKRQTIVSAKMMAAGIIALGMALIYMIGFNSYMKGATAMNFQGTGNIQDVAQTLGLTFHLSGYIILGLSLFFGILLALAIAMILGGFAEDAKSAPGVVAPLMVIVMVPYFLTLFIDINSLAPIYKYLIYAIPFSHTFLAAQNILLGNLNFVFAGIIYQTVAFVIFVYIAAKIFSSDKIFTMKLNFGKRK